MNVLFVERSYIVTNFYGLSRLCRFRKRLISSILAKAQWLPGKFSKERSLLFALSGSINVDITLLISYTIVVVFHTTLPMYRADNGNAFVIKNVEKFSNEIIPDYFKHKKFSSFVRQLNFYGFRKIKTGNVRLTKNNESHYTESKYWKFRHEKFKQGRPDLLSLIRKSGNNTNFDGGTNNNNNSDRTEMEDLKHEIKTLEDTTLLMRSEIAELRHLVQSMATKQQPTQQQQLAGVEQQPSSSLSALPPQQFPMFGQPDSLSMGGMAGLPGPVPLDASYAIISNSTTTATATNENGDGVSSWAATSHHPYAIQNSTGDGHGSFGISSQQMLGSSLPPSPQQQQQESDHYLPSTTTTTNAVQFDEETGMPILPPSSPITHLYHGVSRSASLKYFEDTMLDSLLSLEGGDSLLVDGGSGGDDMSNAVFLDYCI